MTLPDIELVAAECHEDWRQKKLKAGITSRKAAETGEELMVPYAQLSERSKDLNRDPVRIVYAAIERCKDAALKLYTQGPVVGDAIKRLEGK